MAASVIQPALCRSRGEAYWDGLGRPLGDR